MSGLATVPGPVRDTLVSVSDDRRWVEEMTALLRGDPGLGWSRVRDFLTDRRVDPAQAALAILYPDDVRTLVAIVVVSADRMFALDIEYPKGVDDAAAMDHGQVVGWEDDVATIRRENQPFADIALQLLSPD